MNVGPEGETRSSGRHDWVGPGRPLGVEPLAPRDAPFQSDR